MNTAVNIGYVELASDPRYTGGGAFAGIQFYTLARPFTGAEVAIDEASAVENCSRSISRSTRSAGARMPCAGGAVRAWVAAGTHFVAADLPADALVELADAVKDQDVMLVNVSAPEDTLRADLPRQVLHTFPSNAMLADALGAISGHQALEASAGAGRAAAAGHRHGRSLSPHRAKIRADHRR